MLNNFETNLKKAVKNMVPDNMFQRITENLSNSQERTMIMTLKSTKNKTLKWIGAVVAACLLLTVGFTGGTYYMDNIKVDSIVNIDVNPSIELLTNKQEKVLEVNALNDEAKIVIGTMNFKNVDLDIAVNALIGAMVKNNYIAKEDSGILVSVQNNNSAKAEHIRNIIVKDIDDSLKENKVEASVINQTLTNIEEAKNFAEANGISVGKAVFVMNLALKDSSLKAEDLAKLSIKEIAKIVKENKINISDIVDYDEDDSIWENIAEEIEDTNEDVKENKKENKKKENKKNNTSSKVTSTPAPSQPVYTEIGEAKAKANALAHAGLSNSQVTFTKCRLTNDDGIRVYDIEFYSKSYEFDYEINAYTGAIHDYDKELIDDDDDYKKPASSTSNKIISAAKAKEIALNHAGVDASKASFIKAEYDYDDGVKKYEVEFRVGNMEYEYEIDAVSGKIISFDKELDD